MHEKSFYTSIPVHWNAVSFLTSTNVPGRPEISSMRNIPGIVIYNLFTHDFTDEFLDDYADEFTDEFTYEFTDKFTGND